MFGAITPNMATRTERLIHVNNTTEFTTFTGANYGKDSPHPSRIQRTSGIKIHCVNVDIRSQT